MRVAILILATALFVLSGSPLLAQQEYPATAAIRGENIWLRADPAEDTEALTYLQRGDRVRVTADATPSDGDAFYPVEVIETGESGWVRDLAIDPRTFAPRGALPEVVVNEAPTDQDSNQQQEADYAAAMSEETRLLSQSFFAMSDLLGNAQFDDEVWREQVRDIVLSWRRAEKRAEALSPPLAYSEVHAAYLRALGYYNDSGAALLRALDTSDLTFIEVATRDVELARAEMATATQLLEALIEE